MHFVNPHIIVLSLAVFAVCAAVAFKLLMDGWALYLVIKAVRSGEVNVRSLDRSE